MNRDQRLCVLDVEVGKLDGDELDVLVEVARGLVAGRKVYGELRLDTDRRDFDAEASAELRDALVYIAARKIIGARKPAAPSCGSVAPAESAARCDYCSASATDARHRPCCSPHGSHRFSLPY